MKRETKQILAFSILALFLIAFLVGIVGAQTEAKNVDKTKKAGESVGDRIVARRDSSSLKLSDESKNLLSKILLMALVVLIVYSVTSFLPFVPSDKDYVNWLIAIIVGILSFLFVSADNIRYILINYEGLGIVLTSVLPFVILLVVSYRLRMNNPAIANLLNPAFFIGFLLYIGSRWITYRPSENVLPELSYVYPLTFALTAIYLVFERRLSKYFFKKELEGILEGRKTETDTETSAEIARLTQLKSALPEKADVIQKRIDKLMSTMT